MSAFEGKADMKTYSTLGKSGSSVAALPGGRHTTKYMRLIGSQRFDEMAKRKKRVATVNTKLGISINCRVQKPFLKDLDAYRKPLKLSRPAALVKLATEHLAALKEPAEKLWEGAVERMFPAASGVKGDEPK
ncbi:MAG TPA: hypothetical protein VKG24_02750 [Pseudolabrys sp.]|jgi:hypothetical protein|nr:hypothetical protein [Pseudolabrys sp.]